MAEINLGSDSKADNRAAGPEIPSSSQKPQKLIGNSEQKSDTYSTEELNDPAKKKKNKSNNSRCIHSLNRIVWASFLR